MAVAYDLDRTLSALADPTRRRVVDLLRERPRRAGEIAQTFGMSRPAMSRHLRVLRTHGLVEEQRDAGDARARVYQLRPEPIDELSTWIGDVQRFWDDQLESFRQLADEKKHEKHGTKKKGAGR
jgi:DNA-binding transcriptional ArsR family regulator